MYKLQRYFFGAVVLLMAQTAHAVPILYVGNGHSYEVITLDAALTWENAKSAAETLGGHLATISDSNENEFVADLVEIAPGLLTGYWLGGYQPQPIDPADEPHKGWAWVTGEAWSYTNWASGEPNNGRGGIQHYLHFWPSLPLWDDQDYQPHMIGYVVEYGTPPLSVPEPSMIILLSLGLLGLRVARHR